MTRAFTEALIASSGSVLNVLAISGKHPGASSSPTSVSRAAGLAFTKAASKDLGPSGVRVNALLIGLIAGAFCCFMVFEVKKFFGYDDSLDAFGVHGAGGTLGALLTGIFATCVINPAFGKDAAGKLLPTGVLDGHWGQLLNQLAGVSIAWGISIVGTLILLFVVDKTVGLRVSPEHEAAGLDLSQHGEEGYDLNS